MGLGDDTVFTTAEGALISPVITSMSLSWVPRMERGQGASLRPRLCPELRDKGKLGAN